MRERVVNYPRCDLPAVPEFPVMNAIMIDNNVVIPTIDISFLYLWVKQENARLDKAELCLANRSN